jgi:hypothetical protein
VERGRPAGYDRGMLIVALFLILLAATHVGDPDAADRPR